MSQTSDNAGRPVVTNRGGEWLSEAGTTADGQPVDGQNPLAMPQPTVALYIAWQCSECDYNNINPGLVCGVCGAWGPNAAAAHGKSPVSDVQDGAASPEPIAQNTPENADRPPSGNAPTLEQLRVRLREARSENVGLYRKLRVTEDGVRWRERIIADLEERNEKLLSGRNHWRRVAQAEAALRAALGHPTLSICHAGPSPDEGLYCTLFKDHVSQMHVSAVDGCVQARWKDG